MSITAQNVYFLRQGISLLRALDPDLFAAAGGLGGAKGSIGAHMRHCIDCYRCFFAGLETGRIDYDARQRDPRVEVDPTAAEAAIEQIISRLSSLEGADTSRSLEVRVDAAAWEGSPLEWSLTSLGRELQFLLSHTVHHYALIAVLARSRGFEPDASFGVAPSTLAYRGEPALREA